MADSPALEHDDTRLNSASIADPNLADPNLTDPSLTDPGHGGVTVIVDGVIAKIVGIAAREVPGVAALGSGAVRAIGAIRDAISGRDAVNGSDPSQGVSITVDGPRVSADVTLVVEYPHELHKVAADVRAAITDAIETIAGMQVTTVNVTVRDVHQRPDEQTPADSPDDAGTAGTDTE